MDGTAPTASNTISMEQTRAKDANWKSITKMNSRGKTRSADFHQVDGSAQCAPTTTSDQRSNARDASRKSQLMISMECQSTCLIMNPKKIKKTIVECSSPSSKKNKTEML